EGWQARRCGGAGIGLAFVQELVGLHGGHVRVQSAMGQGSTFTVTMPLGAAHLPRERIRAARSLASTGIGADVYAEEAQLWLPDDWAAAESTMAPAPAASQAPSSEPPPARARELIVVADDNADMRKYLMHLLGGAYEVRAVSDGR